MVIRNLHLTDFLKLSRLHEANIGLDVPSSLVIPHSLRSAALSQHLPTAVQNFNSNIFIYEEPEGNPCAFVQTRTRQRRDEWDILALGTIGKNPQPLTEKDLEDIPANPETTTPENSAETELMAQNKMAADIIGVETENQINAESLENINNSGETENEAENSSWPIVNETEIIWTKLLEHLVTDAGERGILRVYAKISEDSPEIELFSQTGFHTFAHESLYRLNYSLAVEKPADAHLRPQRGRDLFPIDQLYHSVTPTLVQHAEAPNSSASSWSLGRNYFPRPLKEQGFVRNENDKVVAYLRLLSYRNRHLLNIMCLDSYRETLPQVIRYALSNIKAGEDVQVYCAVRDYQSEQASMLEEYGFEYFGRQAAMVKHIVQYIKNPERVLVHARDHKLELAHSVIKRRLRPVIRVRQHALLRHKSGWGNT